MPPVTPVMPGSMVLNNNISDRGGFKFTTRQQVAPSISVLGDEAGQQHAATCSLRCPRCRFIGYFLHVAVDQVLEEPDWSTFESINPFTDGTK